MYPLRCALKQQLCEATADPPDGSTLVATGPMGAEVSAEVAGGIQDLGLRMLAAEVAAEQRRALQQRLRHQIKEASGQLQERAAEAGEAQTAV